MCKKKYAKTKHSLGFEFRLFPLAKQVTVRRLESPDWSTVLLTQTHTYAHTYTHTDTHTLTITRKDSYTIPTIFDCIYRFSIHFISLTA